MSEKKLVSEIIYEEIQNLLKLNVLDIDFILKKILEYGKQKQQEVIDDPAEFGIEIPDCDNCDERMGEPIPWDDLG